MEKDLPPPTPHQFISEKNGLNQIHFDKSTGRGTAWKIRAASFLKEGWRCDQKVVNDVMERLKHANDDKSLSEAIGCLNHLNKGQKEKIIKKLSTNFSEKIVDNTVLTAEDIYNVFLNVKKLTDSRKGCEDLASICDRGTQVYAATIELSEAMKTANVENNYNHALILGAVCDGADPNVEINGRTALGLFCSSPLCTVDEVEHMLSLDTNINARDSDGRTALHHACLANNVNVIKFLLERGADVNNVDSSGRTELFDAVDSGSVKAVQELLDMGAKSDIVNNMGNTVLHSAAKTNARMIKCLAKNNDRINSRNHDGDTPLHIACKAEKPDPQLILSLLESWANIYIKNNEGKVPIEIICGLVGDQFNSVKDKVRECESATMRLHTIIHQENPNIELAIKQIKQGANPNIEGGDLLHFVLLKGTPEDVETLIKAGAEIDAHDKYGNTPLISAILEDIPLEKIKILINNGADLNAPDKEGHPPIFQACLSEDYEILELLLESGANINAVDNHFQETLFQYALRTENTKLLCILVSKGVNVNQPDRKGNTPLHLAMTIGNFEMVEILMNARANVFHTNNEGITPYSIFYHNTNITFNLALTDLKNRLEKCKAANDNLEEIIKKSNLQTNFRSIIKEIEKGADPNVKIDGKSLLHIALEYGNINDIKTLIKYGINLEERDPEGNTALYNAYMLADKAEAEEIVKILVENGANVDYTTNLGQTLLFMVCNEQSTEIFRMLAEKSSELTTPNARKENKTILHAVAMLGTKGMVDILLEKGVNVNQQDSNGNTPLHEAINHGNIEVAQALIDAGADTTLKNVQGLTAFSMKPEIAKQLKPKNS